MNGLRKGKKKSSFMTKKMLTLQRGDVDCAGETAKRKGESIFTQGKSMGQEKDAVHTRCDDKT